VTIERRLVLALVALPLVGCSGKPSDAEALRLFSEDNKRIQALEFFEIENPKRINGYEKEGLYILEIQFDLIAKLDAQDLVDALTRQAGPSFFGQQQLSSDLQALKREFGTTFKKGERFTKKRPVVLRRTEAGWALAS